MSAEFMIHACPARMWYVDEFLIPSMIAQGIPERSIEVWNDDSGKGNLASCMDAFADCGRRRGGTWHLQDDVIISRDFAEKTAKLDNGIVCGFVNETFGPNVSMHGDNIPVAFMYNSFQCIRIPNALAGECADWVRTEAPKDSHCQGMIASGKCDDSLWVEFLAARHPDIRVTNLRPCIVDHIDFLLGGSVINRWRGYHARAYWWDDEDRVDELKEKLAHR